jgi:hypothetical protein
MAVLIYRRTGILRAVQLLLGPRRVESTVRYLETSAPGPKPELSIGTRKCATTDVSRCLG